MSLFKDLQDLQESLTGCRKIKFVTVNEKGITIAYDNGLISQSEVELMLKESRVKPIKFESDWITNTLLLKF